MPGDPTEALLHNQTPYTTMNLYNIPVNTLRGKAFDLHQLKGKKVMIVNTASECGYTPQYAQMEELHKSAGDKLVILAFPCDQFGNQEPGGADEIEKFCEVNYGVSFPVMEKCEVKGDDQHPIFKWLCNKEENGVADNKITWNFQKFLIDENGKLVKSVSPETSPLDEEILDWLSI